MRTAIVSIYKHGYYRSDLIEESYHRRSTTGKLHVLSLLTEKELQLIKLSCSDLSYAQIAERMGTTQKSVEGHRDSLFKKLEIRSRVNLAIFAIQYGIVTMEINENDDKNFLIKH
jgi:DNA-binding NarL/FixJ family response regulator